MSFVEDASAQLWRSFMPRRGEVENRATNDYVAMRVYSGQIDDLFSPTTLFDKWAAVEVLSHGSIPDGMENYLSLGGQYAVFIHNGPASAFPKSMKFIFGEWLPGSGFKLDDREHFEILPEGYDPMDRNAREELWIPISDVTGTG